MTASESIAVPALERVSGDLADQRIIVRRCGYFQGRPGTCITTRQSQEDRDRLVSNLGARIRFDDPAQHGYDVGDAEFHGTTLLTGQPMERQLPHRRDRVTERSEECVR